MKYLSFLVVLFTACAPVSQANITLHDRANAGYTTEQLDNVTNLMANRYFANGLVSSKNVVPILVSQANLQLEVQEKPQNVAFEGHHLYLQANRRCPYADGLVTMLTHLLISKVYVDSFTLVGAKPKAYGSSDSSYTRAKWWEAADSVQKELVAKYCRELADDIQ